MAHYLLSQGRAKCIADYEHKRTPVMEAARCGHAAALEAMLRHPQALRTLKVGGEQREGRDLRSFLRPQGVALLCWPSGDLN